MVDRNVYLCYNTSNRVMRCPSKLDHSKEVSHGRTVRNVKELLLEP